MKLSVESWLIVVSYLVIIGAYTSLGVKTSGNNKEQTGLGRAYLLWALGYAVFAVGVFVGGEEATHGGFRSKLQE